MWTLDSIRSLFYGGLPIVFGMLFLGLITLYVRVRWYYTPYWPYQKRILYVLKWCEVWAYIFLAWGSMTLIVYGLEVN